MHQFTLGERNDVAKLRGAPRSLQLTFCSRTLNLSSRGDPSDARIKNKQKAPE
jgi:hypothetical protein